MAILWTCATRPTHLARRTIAPIPLPAEPTLEQIEAEFWRIVESPEEQVESLYGQVGLLARVFLAD